MGYRVGVGVIAAVVVALVAGCGNKASDAPPYDTEWDRSCATDSECVPSPGCCPEPCTEDVINERELARAHAWVEAHCPKDGDCPSAGDCPGHAYLCVRGTCALVYDDSPDYRERQ